MITTGKENTIKLKNAISPRQKRILQLLFPLVETIIEIRKNPFFFFKEKKKKKNNNLPVSGN